MGRKCQPGNHLYFSTIRPTKTYSIMKEHLKYRMSFFSKTESVFPLHIQQSGGRHSAHRPHDAKIRVCQLPARLSLIWSPGLQSILLSRQHRLPRAQKNYLLKLIHGVQVRLVRIRMILYYLSTAYLTYDS